MQLKEHDTGRRVTRAGTEYPILHILSVHPWGWSIGRDVCRADRSLETRQDYDDEAEAHAAWAELTGSE